MDDGHRWRGRVRREARDVGQGRGVSDRDQRTVRRIVGAGGRPGRAVVGRGQGSETGPGALRPVGADRGDGREPRDAEREVGAAGGVVGASRRS